MVTILAVNGIIEADAGCKLKNIVATNACLLIIIVFLIPVTIIVIYVLVSPAIRAFNITHTHNSPLYKVDDWLQSSRDSRKKAKGVIKKQPAT